MPIIVVIDDTQSILQLVSLYLKGAGHQVLTAADGTQGLRVVQENHPDLIITDVMMPGMDGYELTRRLRRDPATARTPIITLTAHSELESKIKAFEAGADDFIPKPFDAGEMVARVNVLLRRAAANATADKGAAPAAAPARKFAHLIAVHSLRGGVGCSTLAVNLGIGLTNLWSEPCLLADFVTTTGQVALMLNLPLKRTWANITHIPLAEFDSQDLDAVITPHVSGLRVLSAPTDAAQSVNLDAARVEKIIELARSRYNYFVTDLPHDFSPVTVAVLNQADEILLVLAPDLASIRAAAATLETYKQFGLPADKIHVLLNWTFAQQGFPRKEIEDALAKPVHFVMPHAPIAFINAINRGAPPLHDKPDDPISPYLEDLAFQVSRAADRNTTPSEPKPAWRRVQKRLATAAPR